MLIYSFGIFFYRVFVWIFSFWNVKARTMISGRKNIIQDVKIFRGDCLSKKLIWFHAASLGEFEQGRVLIERIKAHRPEIKIVLTFFSPSGYEVSKDYPFADFICYLPFDTKKNAKDFLEVLKPDVAIFIKYEFWLNYLQLLKEKQISTYLIAGVFHVKQPFFKWYGAIFRMSLTSYRKIFVQDKQSFQLLSSIGFDSIIAGDTRLDRVLEISHESFSDPKLEAFSENKRIIIIGSSYLEEERLLLEFISQHKLKYPDLSIIIAPHELNENSLSRIENIVSKYKLTLRKYTTDELMAADVLILDTMGMLSKVYRFATLAVIGGGFSSGIHSILEAAVYGIPVIFGPNHSKFSEAKELMECGGGFSVKDYVDFDLVVGKILDNTSFQTELSKHINRYIIQKSGAADKILEEIDFSL